MRARSLINFQVINSEFLSGSSIDKPLIYKIMALAGVADLGSEWDHSNLGQLTTAHDLYIQINHSQGLRILEINAYNL